MFKDVKVGSRMVEQRQLGERHRVEGNSLFKQGRISDAAREYDAGLEHDKHNMALHANAALCSLRSSCYANAIQHCDRVSMSLKADLSMAHPSNVSGCI